MMLSRLAVILAATTIAVPALASEPVLLHAAGSLRTALTEMTGAFEAASGQRVQAKYGPSGTLKDEIAGGAHAEVFASANMEHPQALAMAGKSGPIVLFARNRLCALVRPGLAVESATILDRMLDPSVKLGTSTPRADPSGDYAWEVFRKADRLRPGAFAALDAKALRLAGGANAPVAPPGRTIYGALVAEGKADIFLTYCTNAREAQTQNPANRSCLFRPSLRSGPITDSPWLAAPRHRPTNSPSSFYRSTDSAFWQSMDSPRRLCRNRSRATLQKGSFKLC
jgi:molybdate transport system substrate-binding protein